MRNDYYDYNSFFASCSSSYPYVMDLLDISDTMILGEEVSDVDAIHLPNFVASLKEDVLSNLFSVVVSFDNDGRDGGDWKEIEVVLHHHHSTPRNHHKRRYHHYYHYHYHSPNNEMRRRKMKIYVSMLVNPNQIRSLVHEC